MAADTWPEDIPIWVDGVQKWMTGLTRRTTCHDVIYALLHARGQLDTDSPEQWAVFERWRAVERPLQSRTKVVKVWAAWGAEQPNVQLIVRRLDDYFMPGESTSRTRRRYRHYKGQRSRHTVNCRCSGGRPQCIRCGKLRALEHLVHHMVRQERRLQDIQCRIEHTEHLIAEHEARLHARRVQQEGQDYVLDSYLQLNSPGGDSSSSSSGSDDSLDAVLLAVGEDKLDEYLTLCEKLYDVTQRLEHMQQRAFSLAREIQLASDAKKSDAVRSCDQTSQSATSLEREVERVHVELTRAVAANVLQQQQEIEVKKELMYWDTKLQDRSQRLAQLAEQLAEAETTAESAVIGRQFNPLNSQKADGLFTKEQPGLDHIQSQNTSPRNNMQHTQTPPESKEKDQDTLNDPFPSSEARWLQLTQGYLSQSLPQSRPSQSTETDTSRQTVTFSKGSKFTGKHKLRSQLGDELYPEFWQDLDGKSLWSWSDPQQYNTLYPPDTGVYQFSSDSSTDSGVPGTDGDEHADLPSPSYSQEDATKPPLPPRLIYHSEPDPFSPAEPSSQSSGGRNRAKWAHDLTRPSENDRRLPPRPNGHSEQNSIFPHSLSAYSQLEKKGLLPRLQYRSQGLDSYSEPIAYQQSNHTNSTAADKMYIQENVMHSPLASQQEDHLDSSPTLPVILNEPSASARLANDVKYTDSGRHESTGYASSVLSNDAKNNDSGRHSSGFNVSDYHPNANVKHADSERQSTGYASSVLSKDVRHTDSGRHWTGYLFTSLSNNDVKLTDSGRQTTGYTSRAVSNNVKHTYPGRHLTDNTSCDLSTDVKYSDPGNKLDEQQSNRLNGPSGDLNRSASQDAISVPQDSNTASKSTASNTHSSSSPGGPAVNMTTGLSGILKTRPSQHLPYSNLSASENGQDRFNATELNEGNPLGLTAPSTQLHGGCGEAEWVKPLCSIIDKRACSTEHVRTVKQKDASRAKCVRFADELTSWYWHEDGDCNSDDTGLDSMHSDDVTPLETLV